MEMNFHQLNFDRSEDRDWFVTFLTSQDFPFHVAGTVSRDRVQERIAEGDYNAPSHAVFQVVCDAEPVGTLVLDDLDDGSPLIDLRLDGAVRGRGIGTATVAALPSFVFENYPKIERIEAQTREDNLAMRKALLRNGWVKEAHYRKTWPTADGTKKASIAYAVLREDLELGTTSPLVWEDLSL